MKWMIPWIWTRLRKLNTNEEELDQETSETEEAEETETVDLTEE